MLIAARVFLALIAIASYWSAYRWLNRAHGVRQEFLKSASPPENTTKLLRRILHPGCFYPTAQFNGYSLLAIGTIALLLLVKTLVSP